MRDSRDGLFLQHSRRTEQRTCRNKQDIAVFFGAHIPQDMPAQNGCAAPAPGASGMDVLILAEDHHPAVLVL